jgi:hypothetical protein
VEFPVDNTEIKVGFWSHLCSEWTGDRRLFPEFSPATPVSKQFYGANKSTLASDRRNNYDAQPDKWYVVS